MSVQLKACNYSFFTRVEGTVHFLGVETNLTQGGEVTAHSRKIPHRQTAGVDPCKVKSGGAPAFVQFFEVKACEGNAT